MYLRQSDLFLGMGHNFIKDAMAIAREVSYENGEYIFREGDPANFFYIIIKGKIRLISEEPGQVVYTATSTGDLLGCSCLMGEESYFLSAQCEEISLLLELDQKKMSGILDKDIESSLRFYKNLAGAIGKRLRQMY